MEILGVISLYIHFSGINKNFFGSFSGCFQMSLGNLIEMIPLATIGCIFSSLNLLQNIRNIPLYRRLLLLLMIILLFKYDLFIRFNGFFYPHVLLNIVSSIHLFILFGSSNLFKISKINTIINFITKFTGGIYYIHPIFPKYVLFFTNTKRSYFSSLIIYIICYIICFLGNKKFIQTKFKYLFI